ncbi:MAG: galactokinase family protein [Planctomycetota bacterium]
MDLRTAVLENIPVDYGDSPGDSGFSMATDSETIQELTRQLVKGVATFVAWAPGRLDVMGGITEYSGGCVLSFPLAHRVCAAVQLRNDRRLSIFVSGGSNGTANAPVVIPWDQLSADRTTVLSGLNSSHSNKCGVEMTLCTFGVLAEMLASKMIPAACDGLSIAISSPLGDFTDVGCAAAIAASVVAAVSAALGVDVDVTAAASACQRMENLWLFRPVGCTDATCSLIGQTDSFVVTECPGEIETRSLRLQDGLEVVGVDCGAWSPDSWKDYTKARTTAFMGRLLVDRIVKHERLSDRRWAGHLAQLSVANYVEHVRDRIPTKMKGKEFLDRFGETGDPLTKIDPAEIYKVRSRTEHHIYEELRTRRFLECLTQWIEKPNPHHLVEAGELMMASHWSYGQRCGLGSVEADRVVNLVKDRGQDADLYGARVSGRGGGGVVCILMRSTDRATLAMKNVLAEYHQKTGRIARLIRGSAPGALTTGVQVLPPSAE